MTGERSRKNSGWDTGVDVPFNHSVASPLPFLTLSSLCSWFTHCLLLVASVTTLLLLCHRVCSSPAAYSPSPTLTYINPHSILFPLLPSSYFPVLPPTLLSFTPSPLTISCSLPLLRLWVLKQQKSVGEPLITAALTTIEGDVWRDETRVPENLGWPARIPPAARLTFPFLLCLCEWVCVHVCVNACA